MYQFGRILGRISLSLKILKKTGENVGWGVLHNSGKRNCLLDICIGNLWFVCVFRIHFWIYILFCAERSYWILHASSHRLLIADKHHQMFMMPAINTCLEPQWYESSLIIKSSFTTTILCLSALLPVIHMTSSPYTTLSSLGGMLYSRSSSIRVHLWNTLAPTASIKFILRWHRLFFLPQSFLSSSIHAQLETTHLLPEICTSFNIDPDRSCEHYSYLYSYFLIRCPIPI